MRLNVCKSAAGVGVTSRNQKGTNAQKNTRYKNVHNPHRKRFETSQTAS